MDTDAQNFMLADPAHSYAGSGIFVAHGYRGIAGDLRLFVKDPGRQDLCRREGWRYVFPTRP
jgi:hypothetical protein